MPAPTFLFARAPHAGDALPNRRAPAMSAGARLLLRCAPGGKNAQSNFTKKQKVQYIISENKRQ